MSTHFNKLTPAEDERLAILLEECAEVIQAGGKILRHGLDSYHPEDRERVTNRQLLAKEIGHAQHAINRLIEAGDIFGPSIGKAEEAKEESIKPYLHHQP